MKYHKNKILRTAFLTIGMSIVCTSCGLYNVSMTSVESKLENKTIYLPDPQAVLNCVRTAGPYCPAVPAVNPVDKTKPRTLVTHKPKLVNSFMSAQNDAAISALNAAAQPALVALEDTVQSNLNILYNKALGYSANDAAADQPNTTANNSVPSFSISEYNVYASKIEEATSKGSWEALDDLYEYVGVDEASQYQAKLLKEYFKAYFRYGAFIAIQIDASTVVEEIKEKLKQRLPGLEEADIEDIASDLLAAAKLTDDAWTVGSISDVGFVTRGGQTYKFPAVQITVSLPNPEPNLPQVNYTIIGTDLIRVALHAITDAHQQIPGVSGATGVKNGPLLDFGKAISPDLVDADDFAAIEQRAAQLEAATGAGVGKLVRGVSFFSLNNEALASVIETSIAVMVRKVSENILWCYYACKPDDAVADGISDYPLTFREETISFKNDIESIEITGKAEREN